MLKKRIDAGTVMSRHPEIHSGDLVFAGTRVPVDTLIDYLKNGHSIEDFLQGYPSVTRRQVEAFLELSPDAIERMTAQDAHPH
ncbi:MAG: DUF433 domain-containing protein [Gemmatimonadota bacterium]